MVERRAAVTSLPAARPGLSFAAPLLDIVQISARRDGVPTGLDLPPPGRSTVSGGLTALWVQPRGWLILAAPMGEGVLAARLNQPGLSVVDQSHGRCVVEIAGDQARALLGRLCRIDLHPAAFLPGSVAVTPVADMPCVLHHASADRFALVVFSTYAGSLVHALGQASPA